MTKGPGVSGAAKQGFGWALGCLGFIVVLVVVLAVIGGFGRSSSKPVINVPAATDTPTPTDTLTPTDSPSPPPSFKAISLSGRGTKVVKFNIPADAAAIAGITHKGSSNFIVHSIDGAGAQIDGLVNAIGNYRGTVLFDMNVSDHTAAFQITADGAWTVTIKPIADAPAWDPHHVLKGTGDGVYRLSPPSAGLVTLDLAYRGSENFIVHAYTADNTEGIANEIGNFNGQVLLPDGTELLEVKAAGGSWSMTPG